MMMIIMMKKLILIKVKNFSKNSKKDDDTIKIKNVKIEKNSEEEEE